VDCQDEGKVVSGSSLSTTSYRRLGEWTYISTHALTPALNFGELLISRRSCFEREEGTRFHSVEGWMGLRSCLDVLAKTKILPYRLWNLGHTECRIIPALMGYYIPSRNMKQN
jgi:hypothetical protein